MKHGKKNGDKILFIYLFYSFCSQSILKVNLALHIFVLFTWHSVIMKKCFTRRSYQHLRGPSATTFRLAVRTQMDSHWQHWATKAGRFGWKQVKLNISIPATTVLHLTHSDSWCRCLWLLFYFPPRCLCLTACPVQILIEVMLPVPSPFVSTLTTGCKWHQTNPSPTSASPIITQIKTCEE